MGSKKTAYCDVCFRYKTKENLLGSAEKAVWTEHLNTAALSREQYRTDRERAKAGTIDMFCVDKAESLRAPRKSAEQPSAVL